MQRLSRFIAVFFLVFVGTGFLFAANNRYALVIGNGNYRNKSIATLANPVNDATDMAAALRDLGYNVTLKTNIGLREMLDAVQDFSFNLKRSNENEGFFWFAGHGLSVKGIHYMLPVDVDPVNDNIIARGAYSVDDLMDEIGSARNKTNLIVIDACRNTLLPGGNRSVGGRGLTVLASDDYRITGNKVVYSTMAGRTASDGVPGSRNSPFARAFISNIKKPEAFDDVFLDIANETMRLTQGEQQPYSMGSFAVKSYTLNPLPPAPLPALAVAPAAAEAAPSPAPVSSQSQPDQTEGHFFRQDGPWTLGGRLGMAFGFNSSSDLGSAARDAMAGLGSATDKMKINFNFAVYGNYSFTDRLAIQIELNGMINQGYKLELSAGGVSETVDISYSSLDIPILLKYNFIRNLWLLGIQAGPHISIPVGKTDLSAPDQSGSIDISTAATFGLTAGLFGGYTVGPGRIIGDLRFIFDFNKVEGEQNGVKQAFILRRALLLTVGYEVSF